MSRYYDYGNAISWNNQALPSGGSGHSGGSQGKDPLAPALPGSRTLYQHPAVTGYNPQDSRGQAMPVTARQNPMYAGSMYHGYGHGAGSATLAPMPSPSPTAPLPPFPVHPDVKFKKLPFYDVMAELMKPSTMMPMQAGRMQEGTYIFHLTPQQATEIASGKDIVGTSNKLDYVIQAQLRFCLLETSCEQEDYFPPSVSVKVNNKMCPLPNPIPTNKPTPEPKRPPRPVNISSLVKLSPTVANTIHVTWAADFTRAYVLSVFMVRKLTSAELLQRLKNKGTKNPDYTRSLIKEKLSEDYDSEIATTSLRVSLMCPLGKMRMSCPCRPANCPHLQCFDASLFLQMNERKPTWLCPVCDRPAPYDSLVVDGYFQEVLTSGRLAGECGEVQLHADGSWSAHAPPARPAPAPLPEPVTLIADDLEISKNLVPASPVTQSPVEAITCSVEEAVIQPTPTVSILRVLNPPTTPSSGPTPSKRPRRSLQLRDKMDSGSEDECDADDEEEPCDRREERMNMRRIRDEEVMNEDGCEESDHDDDDMLGNGMDVDLEPPTVTGEHGEDESMGEERVIVDGVFDSLEQGVVILEHGECEGGAVDEVRVAGDGMGETLELPPVGQEYGLDAFSWSEDFSSFSGREETYLRAPGPTLECHDPVQVFMKVWDERIMEEIVRETNRYAWQIIAPLSETENGLPENLEWTDTTVSEMFRYFAMLILTSMCYRSTMGDYWTTGLLEMPALRKVMSRNRFFLITRFLHFVDNDRYNPSLSSNEKKISKIVPIVNHCNRKFGELYIPRKHLSLDESLLLWSPQCRIKSIELCEAVTGYQLRCLLYTHNMSSMSREPIHGFENGPAKVVLELMDGFLDVGHTLVMDNWYNQLSLTRFLKKRRTDVIGSINRRRTHIPNAIKTASEKRMVRGQQVARHCGDISLIAWKDVKLVTVMSTFHDDRQVPTRRPGGRIMKPLQVIEYNKYMAGVDSKDRKLSTYTMEKKKSQKWYMKVFKRLLNTSLLNTFIIYSKNPRPKQLGHREFRYEVAHGLLELFPKEEVPANSAPPRAPPPRELGKKEKRLQTADHFIAHTETVADMTHRKHKQMRCVRCNAAGRRTMVTYKCTFCDVPLCPGPCWADYHQLKKL